MMAASKLRFLKTYASYILLALVILAPLLSSGYILTLDAVFVPHIAAPAAMGSDYLWQMLLHILNFAVPSQILEKLIFIGIVLGSGIGTHQLITYLAGRIRIRKELQWGWAPYIGGLLYVANPFTYDRFMAGQYGLLLGYMLLPFALRFLLEFTARQSRREVVRLAIITVVMGIISLPTIGLFALVAMCVILANAWQKRHDGQALKHYFQSCLIVLGTFTVLSSYWLIPLVTGHGAAAQTISEFNGAHTAAFETVGSNMLSRLGAALRLQGFWAESHQLFTLPQDKLPGWGTIRLLVWALVAFGAVTLWKQSRMLAAALLATLAGSSLLAAGLLSGLLTHAGYREPQKFAGPLALVFAVFAAFGAARLHGWALQKRSELWQATIPAAAILVVLLFTPTMYWGFAGQLTPRQYPQGWATANDYLNRQQGNFNTVFLPWHQYMSFHFAGRIIANPGTKFFQQPVIVGNDPELGRIQPPAGQQATGIGALVNPQAPHAQLAARLAAQNVRYVLLAKDYDFTKYNYISRTPNMRLAQDTASIAIYENQAWKGGK
jgi:hypothetical protein